MKEFSCNVLVPDCWATFEGETDGEVLEQVAVHAREEHGMHELPPEVVDQVRAAISELSP
jgi:predicted small metal-binding protein